MAFGFGSQREGSEISSYAQTLISSGRSTTDNHRILCDGCGQVILFPILWNYLIFTKITVNYRHKVSMWALPVKTYCIQPCEVLSSPSLYTSEISLFQCSYCERRSYLIHDPMHIFFKLPRPVHRALEDPYPILPPL